MSEFENPFGIIEDPLELPRGKGVDVRPLNRLFHNVSSSYKFYWFLAILDEVIAGNNPISMERLTERMLLWAWYPVVVCRLSLGPNESIPSLLTELQHLHQGDVTTVSEIHDIVKSNPDFRNHLKILRKMVPYRLLSAWGISGSDRTVKELSCDYERDCLYEIRSAEEIAVGFKWVIYIGQYERILRDFTLWHLCQYLEKRNPNVPNIAGKIVCPSKRASLAKQTKFWNEVLGNHPMHCIYSGKTLCPGDFQLDHFVPWSFVAHDQLWNLIPALPEVNASKSDRLPDLDYYLPRYAAFQLEALRFHLQEYPVRKANELLEDYCAVRVPLEDILSLPESVFAERLRSSFSPIIEIASNMGFESHWRYV